MCCYLEAAHAGASFIGPDFEEFKRPGARTYTVGNPDSFFEKINYLIENPQKILNDVLQAKEQATTTLELGEVNKIRDEVFTRLIS